MKKLRGTRYVKLAIPALTWILMPIPVLVISAIGKQSSDINQGVNLANTLEQGTGDQGIMFWLC